MGDEASETGSRRGSAYAKMDLGIRLKPEKQQAQGRAVESGRSGRLCEQAIQDRKRRGIIDIKKSSVTQSKGGGWGGSWDKAVDR